MPDQYDRAIDGLDHVADDAGVEADASQRVRRGEHRVACAFELADHSREPGRVGEGTMDEDDGRTRHGGSPQDWAGGPHDVTSADPERADPGAPPQAFGIVTGMHGPGDTGYCCTARR